MNRVSFVFGSSFFISAIGKIEMLYVMTDSGAGCSTASA
jgi:hypothetical protein